ncbi:hypothetical protein E4U55_004279 [Claviceps digitariae]|nr:hypothetical protein E4U55_004279 [Claviceps digitariae]
MDDPQPLPTQTTDPISRPSSTSTTASANLQQLPGISALAVSNTTQDSPQLRATVAPQNPTYTGATPATTNGNGNLPTCQNCATSTTPLWRRDEFGSVLCNACGLFLKLHGRPRPISLKTDVIKSRNRVKTMRPDLAAKKKVSIHLGHTSSYLYKLLWEANTACARRNNHHQQQQQQAQNFGLTDVSGTDFAAQNAAAQAIRRTSQKSLNGNEGSDSPMSRNGTPSMYNQGLPSFMVDDSYHSGAFNGTSEHGDRDAPQTHEQLIAYSSSLKTRVSELEVINELFRGRLSQLEQQEAAARRGQEVAGVEQTQLREQLEAALESEAQLRAQLEDSHRRENNLKRRLDELELELQALRIIPDDGTNRSNKRPRVDGDELLAPDAVPEPDPQPEREPEPEPGQEEFHDPLLQAAHPDDLNPTEAAQMQEMVVEESTSAHEEPAAIEEAPASTEAAEAMEP